MTISQMMLPEFDQEMGNTRKMLERMPDKGYDYKPHEKSMTFGRLAGHVAEMPGWALVTLTQDKLELTPEMSSTTGTSRAQLLEVFEKGVGPARAALEAATDEDMMKPWSLIMGGHTVFTMPKAAVMRGVVMNHLIHHRAQLGVYMRMLDIPVPGIYGPSADEK